jgi:hypothetical protein
MRPPRWYDPILDWFRWDYMKLRWRSFWCPHTDQWFDRSLCWDCNGMHYYCKRCEKRTDKCKP